MADYPRCATCRYWDYMAGTGHKNTGLCLLTLFSDGQPDPPKDYGRTPLATAYDAEGYSAYLNTDAEFGCVMHEPMEGSP